MSPYETLAHYIEGGWGALASDFFRYALLAKGLGHRVDLDLVFLKPIDFEDEYVFGWENKKSINGAVLRLPRASDMLRECATSAAQLATAFLRAEKSGVVLLGAIHQARDSARRLQLGDFGPLILTYLARKYGVAGKAKARTVFYPVMHFQVEIPWPAGVGRKPSDR